MLGLVGRELGVMLCWQTPRLGPQLFIKRVDFYRYHVVFMQHYLATQGTSCSQVDPGRDWLVLLLVSIQPRYKGGWVSTERGRVRFPSPQPGMCFLQKLE